jgi:hypothetical protein
VEEQFGQWMMATWRRRSNVKKAPVMTSNNSLNKNPINNQTISRTSMMSKEILKL